MGEDRAEPWRAVARAQGGLITRAQLRALGVSRRREDRRVAAEQWQLVAPQVVATVTGELSDDQRAWLGVLHAGEGALVAGIHALSTHGLRNWSRDEIEIVVPYANRVPAPIVGLRFIRSRRDLSGMRASGRGLPYCRIEPAALLWASRQRSTRTADGLVAAVVQQRLATAASLGEWIDALAPLRGSARIRDSLVDIAGGAHSRAEIDVARMCRRHRIVPPARQVKRKDASGRTRFTDCEWRLANGRVLVLEVDGSFHMDVEHWEDDIARQRALASPGRLEVRCTTRELREDDARVAADLIRLGVPRRL